MMKPHYLMYLAFFFLSLDNFPFMFGTAYKPVSLLFLVMYFTIKIPEIIRLEWKRMELFIFFTIMLSFVISAVMIGFNNYSLDGLFDSVTSFLAGVIIYLAIKHFIMKTQLEVRLKSLEMLLYGYTIPVFIGLLQVIYIYVAPLGFIEHITSLFVARTDYINTGRVHFTFSEPSFTSIHTNLIMIPSLFILNKFKPINRCIKGIVILFFILSLLTLSVRYYMDITFALIVYFILYLRVKNIFKLFFLVPALVGILVVVINFTGSSKDSYHVQRFMKVMENPEEIVSDPSFQIRNTYSSIGYNAFLDNKLVGVGIGNYVDYYKKNLPTVNHDYKKFPELINAREHSNVIAQYNMYTRLLSEMGIMGLIIILLMTGILITLRNDRYKLFISILLIWTLIQFDSFAFIPMYLILCLNSKNWNEEGSMKKFENKNNYLNIRNKHFSSAL
ncbi:MAG: O-antigen ligase family protein [Bacillus sp. (in: firmicutes)]